MILNNEKYAMIAFPHIFVNEQMPLEQELAPDLWSFRKAPFGLTNAWKRWIGSLKADQLQKADLFLLAKGSCKSPNVLDEDNKKYQERVFHFYAGILLSGFMSCDFDPYIVSGANANHQINVRTVAEYRVPIEPPGAPVKGVDSSWLARAAKLADSMEELSKKGQFHRVIKSIRTFLRGLEEQDIGTRLHQFTRCIEVFIYPRQGKTRADFIARSVLFIGTPHNHLMGEIFDIRSSVEHMHDPLRSVNT